VYNKITFQITGRCPVQYKLLYLTETLVREHCDQRSHEH